MARKYKRRRRNAANETVLLLIIGGFLAAGAFGTSGNDLSSRTILVVMLIVVLLGLMVLGYAFYIEARRRKALRLLDLLATDSMSGLAFEKWVGVQLQARGYKVKLTPINDYGVDIVAKKDGIRTAVQAKHYNSRALDQKPIREAAAGMLHYKCSRSMGVTNNYFTKAAKVLAQSNGCELIDRDQLAEWLAESR